ncbi:MAG: peptide chain release factor N(5)-glutamine methyltransferase [Patescibacteria group bacterium]
MTTGEVLKGAHQKAGRDQNKKLELELLLSFILQCERAFLFINHQTELSAKNLKEFRRLEKKLFAGWPLAYLTGEREFYGLPFFVNQATLIPRPESEMIVDLVKEEARRYAKATLIDIGTGSGCLIISLAAELGNNFNYYGFDISEKALETARKNAKRNSVRINFRQSDLLTNLPKQKGKVFLVANLPYLTKEQVKSEPSIEKEPKSALISGADGFKDYRNLFKQIAKWDDLKDFYLIIEIDPGQTKLVKMEVKKYLSEMQVEIIKDLRKKNRFAIIRQ